MDVLKITSDINFVYFDYQDLYIDGKSNVSKRKFQRSSIIDVSCGKDNIEITLLGGEIITLSNGSDYKKLSIPVVAEVDASPIVNLGELYDSIASLMK